MKKETLCDVERFGLEETGRTLVTIELKKHGTLRHFTEIEKSLYFDLCEFARLRGEDEVAHLEDALEVAVNPPELLELYGPAQARLSGLLGERHQPSGDPLSPSDTQSPA